VQLDKGEIHFLLPPGLWYYARSSNVRGKTLAPDSQAAWLVPEHAHEFSGYIALGPPRGKRATAEGAVFGSYTLGVTTNRDEWRYAFSPEALTIKAPGFIQAYNEHVHRWASLPAKPASLDDFVTYDEKRIKWSRDLKSDVQRGKQCRFDQENIRTALYRPFQKAYLYYDPICNEEPRQFATVFPPHASQIHNVAIVVTGIASEKPFMALATNSRVDLHLVGVGAGAQCFPFYVLPDGPEHPQENITDWALSRFRTHYSDPAITKWGIFYYIYGILHHPWLPKPLCR
jgi:predicted helicase